jgi:hypothetical protein
MVLGEDIVGLPSSPGESISDGQHAAAAASFPPAAPRASPSPVTTNPAQALGGGDRDDLVEADGLVGPRPERAQLDRHAATLEVPASRWRASRLAREALRLDCDPAETSTCPL